MLDAEGVSAADRPRDALAPARIGSRADEALQELQNGRRARRELRERGRRVLAPHLIEQEGAEQAVVLVRHLGALATVDEEVAPAEGFHQVACARVYRQVILGEFDEHRPSK